MSEELGAAPAPGPAESAPVQDAPQVDSTPAPEATDAPEPKEAPKLSAREAVQKAMKSAPEGETSDTAETETQTDAPKEAKSAPQPRNERGQFTKPGESDPAAPTEADKTATAPKTPAVDVPEALSRVSDEAKKAWSEAPEPLRRDIQERFTQYEQGLQQYQQFAQALRPYIEHAAKNQTNLPQMLAAYTQAERMLSQDPVTGVAQLLKQLGKDPFEVAMGLLDHNPQAQPQQPQQPVVDHEKEQMRQQLQQMQHQQHHAKVERGVDDFWAKHPDAEEVAPQIAETLRRMQRTDDPIADLQWAYEMVRVRAPQPAEPEKPQPSVRLQAAANLSTSGAPQNGSSPAPRRNHSSVRDAVQAARAANGRA